MTAYPTALHCATCGALETAHELRTDGRTRGKRLGQTAGSTGNELCAGFVAGVAVEMVPEGELRRRLDAVLALHEVAPAVGCDEGMRCDLHSREVCKRCRERWPCPTVRAARGET